MTLSEEQVRKFIFSGGERCPECGQDQLEGGPFQVDGSRAFQELSCNHCDKAWESEYTLTGVNER
jgi:transposase-like protein